MSNIIIQPTILNKAIQIINEKNRIEQEKRNIEKYKTLCIKAEICPVCGNTLNNRKATKQEEKRSGYDYVNYVLECDKKHFIYMNGEDFHDDDDY